MFRVLAAIVTAKFLFKAFIGPIADRLAQSRGVDAAHKDGVKLLEEAWVMLGNIIMLAISIDVMMNYNGGCTFSNTKPCLKGWPAHSLSRQAAFYYRFESAWYVHLLLKPVLKYGPKDGRDMMLHHVASLSLIVVSFAFNLTRMGT